MLILVTQVLVVQRNLSSRDCGGDWSIRVLKKYDQKREPIVIGTPLVKDHVATITWRSAS